MATNAKDLFTWKRESKPRVYSRSRRVTSDDDIQDWIQTVEEASERAAAATFGASYAPKSRVSGRSMAKERAMDAHIMEAAYAEAQDILQQWVDEKILLNSCEEGEESPVCSGKTKAQITREWDHLLDGYEESSAELKEAEEADLVDSVLQSLLDKDLTQEDPRWRHLKEDSPMKTQDPRTKMELRRQQVKENRAKREKEKEEQRKEAQQRKEAWCQARQMVQKEEQAKAARAWREEQEIQREMARIRKQMEEERHKREELHRRDRARQLRMEQDAAEAAVLKEAERAEVMASARQQVAQEEKVDMQRALAMQKWQAARRQRLLRRHFSAWHSAVLEQRLQGARAQAVADWRRLQRAFSAWKLWARSEQSARQAALHQHRLQREQRAGLRAQAHHQRHLLAKAFSAWQRFVSLQQQSRSLLQEQQNTRSKMAAFLEAAASGRLRPEAEDLRASRSTEDLRLLGAVEKEVKSLSGENQCREGRRKSFSGQSNATPQQQPWQLTRKHAQVTPKDLAAAAGKRGNVAVPAVTAGERTSTPVEQEGGASPVESQGGGARCVASAGQPKGPPGGSSFAHHHAAQQKMLKQQQQQLMEQRKMIEQLAQQLKPSEQQGEGEAPAELSSQRSESSLTVVSQMSTARSESSEASSATQISGSKSARKVEPDARHLTFLKGMEQRAAERARMKQARKEKRRRAELERLEKMQMEEQRLQEELQAEKRQKAEALREKRRLQKEREKEQQELHARLAELSGVAVEFHRKALMRYRGWKPWTQLVAQARENQKKAEMFHQHSLLRRVLSAWHGTVRSDLEEKERAAEQMHRVFLMRRTFRHLKRIGQQMSILEEKADRFRARKLLTRVVREWADWTAEEKISAWRKERMAQEHNVSRLLRSCLRAWRHLPQVQKEEVAREERLKEMRQRVASLLPDFAPSDPSPL